MILHDNDTLQLHDEQKPSLAAFFATILATLACLIFNGIPAVSEAACSTPIFCPCDSHEGRSGLHAKLTAIDNNAIRLQVVEVFGDSISTVQVGDEVGGEFSSSYPCGGTLELPAVGNEVLALYEPGDADRYPGCSEYRDCSEVRCGTIPSGSPEWDRCDGQCVTDTVEVCSSHREEALLSGRVDITPWAEDINLGGAGSPGGNRNTTPSQLGNWLDEEGLVRHDVCRNVFEPPSITPCDDSHGENRAGCTVSENSHDPSSNILLLLAAMALICCFARGGINRTSKSIPGPARK